MESNSYLDFEINYGKIAMKMLRYEIMARCEILTIDIIFFTLQ